LNLPNKARILPAGSWKPTSCWQYVVVAKKTFRYPKIIRQSLIPPFSVKEFIYESGIAI
jgi:hypothetical protein